MDIQARIQSMVDAHPVVLFMKGTRQEPRCGFSASLIDCLDGYLDHYQTVDVLTTEGVRDGIKAFSDWPTIPQLYVKGAFVGGSDIVLELHQSGELAPLLGVATPEPGVIDVTITPAAKEAILRLWEAEGGAASEAPDLRLEFDRDFQPSLFFDDPKQGDLVAEGEGLRLVMDSASVRRGQEVTIDWVTRDGNEGFHIENSSEPAKVEELSPTDLKRWLDEGKPITLLDVRSEEELSQASIPAAVRLDEQLIDKLDTMPRDTVLVFLCHHGVRSRQAGEHCLKMGYGKVFSVTGGIDAWSQEVDTSVPRY